MKRHDKIPNLSLLILAGGKSSRMKKDKSQLPWQDSTTLTHMLTNSYVYPFERTVIQQNTSETGDLTRSVTLLLYPTVIQTAAL